MRDKHCASVPVDEAYEADCSLRMPNLFADNAGQRTRMGYIEAHETLISNEKFAWLFPPAWVDGFAHSSDHARRVEKRNPIPQKN